jgi:hypothetical protein
MDYSAFLARGEWTRGAGRTRPTENSTIQRIGLTTKPLVWSGRLTISIIRSGHGAGDAVLEDRAASSSSTPCKSAHIAAESSDGARRGQAQAPALAIPTDVLLEP